MKLGPRNVIFVLFRRKDNYAVYNDVTGCVSNCHIGAFILLGFLNR